MTNWASFDTMGYPTIQQVWKEVATVVDSPRFVLGFKTLAELIPDVVGEPLENEHHNPENGDGLQQTTRGLLVWRKSDNWTAFTDGYRTWINGPNGLQQRLNEERFEWECGEPLVHDIRAALPLAPWNEHPTRSLAAIRIIVVHWDGGPVTLPAQYDPVAYYSTEALYHINKDWGGGSRGYGLMYHEKLSRDGQAWITRPDTDVVWAATQANPFSYNLCVDANEYSAPTHAQMEALETRLATLCGQYGVARSQVYGHGELTQYGNSTSCPGPDLLELVREYRGAA